jgi:hypothetical protein
MPDTWFGLENRKKISQIINRDLCLLLLSLIYFMGVTQQMSEEKGIFQLSIYDLSNITEILETLWLQRSFNSSFLKILTVCKFQNS